MSNKISEINYIRPYIIASEDFENKYSQYDCQKTKQI